MKTTPIMEPHNPNPPIWALWLICAGLPLLMTGGKPVASLLIGGFLYLIFRFGPGRLILALPFLGAISKRVVAEGQNALIRFIGKQPAYIDVAVDSKPGVISACGIAYADGHVFLMQSGDAVKVPWEKIRTWTWEIPGHNEIVTAGSMAPSDIAFEHKANMANFKAKADAANSSGFFVNIADIEHPSWHFRSTDEKTLRKWYEIFNQLNENGGLLPAA